MQEFRGPSNTLRSLTHEVPGRAVHMALEARWWKELDLQCNKKLPAAHTAQQCQQQDKEGGDEPNPRACF